MARPDRLGRIGDPGVDPLLTIICTLYICEQSLIYHATSAGLVRYNTNHTSHLDLYHIPEMTAAI